MIYQRELSCIRILGGDPGLATGLAIYDTDLCAFTHMVETGKGIYGFKPKFKELMGGLTNPYGITHVAFENFTLRSSNKFTADLSGVEIIGWMKGEGFWSKRNPEPSQHMKLTKLGEKDPKGESKVTKLMQEGGFKIGKGHTRMAGSVAIWYAAMVLKHEPTLELLKPKDS